MNARQGLLMNPQEEDAYRASPELSADPQSPSFKAASAPTAGRLSRRSRWIGGLIAVLVIAALCGLAWYLTRPATPGEGGGGAAGTRRVVSSTVGVATAERASIPVLLDALGTVTPQATVRVRPQVSGVLEKILFTEGQMVKKGDLLATIDPRQFEMAVLQATGQRQRDEAQLDSARVTLQRFKTLLGQDSIARQEVDSQAALVKQLEGTIAINRANEGAARLNLGYTRLVAPISGRVGLRAVDVGNVVSSGDVNGVAVITQLAPIDVVFAVPQDQVSELQQRSRSTPNAPAASMPVTALDRTRSSVLDTGVFASLDNQIDITTGTVKAKARFANAQLALFPSQFVNVQVLVRTIENAVVVPVTAVRKGTSGDYVYVLNSNRTVSARPVQRGQATVDKIVIASGLQAGERVITEGGDRLKDGSPVVLPGDAPRAAGGAAAANGGNGGNAKRQRADGAPAGPGRAASNAAVGTSDSALPAAATPASSPGVPESAAAASAASGPMPDASSPRPRRRAASAEGA